MKKNFSMKVYSFQEVTPLNLNFVRGGTATEGGECCIKKHRM